MATTPCINCGQPLPAGAAFCGNCGSRQTPANQGAPRQQPPPPVPSASDYAPTQLQPPPVPPTQDATLRASAPPAQDAYGAPYVPPPPPGGYSQYSGPGSGPGTLGSSPTYPQTFDQKTQLGPPPGYAPGMPPPGYAPGVPPPPPGYAPGPPPPVGPGGPAPWAQPQKGGGRRVALGCIIAVVLVVALLGGGGVLAFFLLKGHGTSNSGQQAGTTPGTGATPGATSTPGGTHGGGATPTVGPNGQQILSNLNLQAIYAGVTVTIMSAVQEKSDPEYQPGDPSMDVLKIRAKLDNSNDTHDVYITENTNVVGANGTPYQVETTNPTDSLPVDVAAQSHSTGYWFFVVPRSTHISDWQVVLGANNEVQETIPLNGVGYDSTMWTETPKPLTQKNMVTYYDGAIVGTVTKVATGVWTPGYQAPQGMRFILVDLYVSNTLATDVYVGDPEFVLVGPDSSRYAQDSGHGYLINVDLGAHASMDVGYACFVVPPAPGDFQMVFFNKDNGVAGMVDLGTL